MTPAVTAANKVYDGTTSGDAHELHGDGVVGGDAVTCTGTAAFDTASVGTGKTVTASGLTLTRRGGGQLHAVGDDGDDDRGHHGGDGDAGDHGGEQGLRRHDGGDAHELHGDGASAATWWRAPARRAFDTASVGTGKTVTVTA